MWYQGAVYSLLVAGKNTYSLHGISVLYMGDNSPRFMAIAYSSFCVSSYFVCDIIVNSCSHYSLGCFTNTKRSSDYILVKCWSGEQRDEYQSTSGSGNDGESDISDVNEGRTENLSNNNGK